MPVVLVVEFAAGCRRPRWRHRWPPLPGAGLARRSFSPPRPSDREVATTPPGERSARWSGRPSPSPQKRWPERSPGRSASSRPCRNWRRLPRTSRPPRDPCECCVAEDNPTNQRLAVVLLERLGHRVVVRRQRHRGRRASPGRELRRDLDGRPDARQGRVGGHPGDRSRRWATSGRASSPSLRTRRARTGPAALAVLQGSMTHLTKPIRRPDLIAALAAVPVPEAVEREPGGPDPRRAAGDPQQARRAHRRRGRGVRGRDDRLVRTGPAWAA